MGSMSGPTRRLPRARRAPREDKGAAAGHARDDRRGDLGLCQAVQVVRVILQRVVVAQRGHAHRLGAQGQLRARRSLVARARGCAGPRASASSCLVARVSCAALCRVDSDGFGRTSEKTMHAPCGSATPPQAHHSRSAAPHAHAQECSVIHKNAATNTASTVARVDKRSRAGGRARGRGRRARASSLPLAMR